MTSQSELHIYLARLIADARQKMGYATIKEIYQTHTPSVDYQTWSHAEAGRRIPHPNSLLEIARILKISREDLILAYCKDKFPDEESQQIIETFHCKKFVDVNTLLKAIDHNNHDDYIFTNEQVDAIRNDIRLRLYLIYTWNRKLTTTFDRLQRFFKVPEEDVQEVVNKLVSLNLVRIEGTTIRRMHRHTTTPRTTDVFNLRQQLLFRTLALNIKPESYISNYHITLTEASYKKIMELLYFTEANFIRFEKSEDRKGGKSRFQIAIVASKIDDDCEHTES